MTTITRYIVQNRDDVTQDRNTAGNYYPNTIWTPGGNLGTAPLDTILIFRNISIPRRSKINSAVMHYFFVSNTGLPTYSTIYGLNQSNPFTVFPNDFYTRPLTTASVDYDISTSLTAGVEYTSPDISSIVQEIVNRDDWGSGHGLGVMFKDRGSGNDKRNRFNQMDATDGTQAPFIVIDFTPADLPITTMRVSVPLRNALTDTDPSHFSLIADTDNVLIKEALRGSVSVTAGGNQTITHNLGYYPDVFVYAKLTGADDSVILHSDVTKEVGYSNPSYFRFNDVNSFTIYSHDSVTLVAKYYVFYNAAEI